MKNKFNMFNNFKLFIIAIITLMISQNAGAVLRSGYVNYHSKDSMMEGYLVYDNDKKFKNPRPAILVVHDWMGLGSFTEEKAKILARQGYIAFAVDIFGKGIRPKNEKEAGKLITDYLNNRLLLREHIMAAFEKIKNIKEVDKSKIIVMGYCFGGTTALELARSGAPLAGTVSFHGGLSSPTPDDAKNIHGRVLVMHGMKDTFVTTEDMNIFKESMKKYNIDMKFIGYENAVHAFTNPQAGNDKSTGIAYNAAADKKSWEDFEAFLKEVAQL